jgi:hypothetical protein
VRRQQTLCTAKRKYSHLAETAFAKQIHQHIPPRHCLEPVKSGAKNCHIDPQINAQALTRHLERSSSLMRLNSRITCRELQWRCRGNIHKAHSGPPALQPLLFFRNDSFFALYCLQNAFKFGSIKPYRRWVT